MTINSIISSMPAYTSYSNISTSSDSCEDEELALILEQYDSENLKYEDAIAIQEAFEASEINNEQSQESFLEDFGFDTQEIEDLISTYEEQSSPPPPPPSNEEKNEITEKLQEVFSSDENLSEENLTDYEDYTSRIVSLNDDSKQKAFDILENYNQENRTLSQNDVNSVVNNSLKQIFENPNNYNRVSFYA